MSEHRYPMDALIGDYARAGAGLVLAGAPLALVPLNLYVEAALGALAALFGAFGGLTALRHLRIRQAQFTVARLLITDRHQRRAPVLIP